MLAWQELVGPDWRNKLRRLLPPVISSFLCFCFVVIKPLSNLGGEYAFLCYTGLLLFCFPGGTIGAEIEAVVLGLLFVSCGLAWSVATLAVAAYCAGDYGTDSDQSRAVIGAGLGILAFISGLIRSHAPRLALPSRIGLFFPVFLLTAEQGVTKATSRLFLEQFYVALFAGVFGLVPIAIIANKSSGPALGSSIVGVISTMCELLPVSLSAFLDDPDSIRPDLADKSEAGLQTEHARLSKSLRLNAANIDPTLKAYAIEVVHGHLPPYSLQPIVNALKDLVRNPLLGSSSHIPGERIQAALARVGEQVSRPPSLIGSRRNTSVPPQREGRSLYAERHAFPTTIPSYIRTDSISPPASVPQSSSPPAIGPKLAERWAELSTCICASLQTVSERLSTTWGWSLPRSDQDTNSDTRRNLISAIDHFETDLAHALDPDGGYGRALSGSRSPRRSPDWRSSLAASAERDNFRLAFYMVSLLDLGRDTLTLYDTVERVSAGASGVKRWHIPHLPKWLHMPKINQVDTLIEESMNEAIEQIQRDGEPSMPFNDPDFIQASLQREHHAKFPSASPRDRFKLHWRTVWDSHRILRLRIFLSRVIHTARHSRNIIFASKLSVGIILLSIPALLPPGTAGRRWFLDFRGSWMVVSYLYVLDTHTGAIFRVGFFRIIGTFIGAVTAYVFTLIAHDNPYALVTLATLHSIPIAYIILFTTFPGVGTVAGITLPPLLFLNYLDLAMGHDPFFLAWTRFVDISIGIIAAVLVGTFVWPDHARVRYFSAVSITLERLTEYYLQLSRDNLRSTLVYQNDKRKYTSLDAAVRREITAARTLVFVQRNEIALLPRPIRLYGEILDASERLIETMIEIRLLRFSVPRKETVLDVLPLRSELVSAILINLWACSQAFRSRSPLPQFLPSPRLALEELMITVDEHKRSTRQRTRSGISQRSATPSTMIDGGVKDEKGGKEQLAMLYAMAEGEALREVCDLIDELVAAAKTLFGSQTFLDTSVRLASPQLP